MIVSNDSKRVLAAPTVVSMHRRVFGSMPVSAVRVAISIFSLQQASRKATSSCFSDRLTTATARCKRRNCCYGNVTDTAGSVTEVLPGDRLRTPESVRSIAVRGGCFPGKFESLRLSRFPRPQPVRRSGWIAPAAKETGMRRARRRAAGRSREPASRRWRRDRRPIISSV